MPEQWRARVEAIHHFWELDHNLQQHDYDMSLVMYAARLDTSLFTILISNVLKHPFCTLNVEAVLQSVQLHVGGSLCCSV